MVDVGKNKYVLNKGDPMRMFKKQNLRSMILNNKVTPNPLKNLVQINKFVHNLHDKAHQK